MILELDHSIPYLIDAAAKAKQEQEAAQMKQTKLLKALADCDLFAWGEKATLVVSVPALNGCILIRRKVVTDDLDRDFVNEIELHPITEIKP